MTPVTEISHAEARLPRWMLALAALGSMLALVLGQPRFSAGLVVGAGLGLLNYFWLHQVVVGLMGAARNRPPWTLIAKFVLRYPLAFAGVYLIYRSGWVSLAGLLGGLFVPAGGVLVEGLMQIGAGLRDGFGAH